jgi:hypothetical protein
VVTLGWTTAVAGIGEGEIQIWIVDCRVAAAAPSIVTVWLPVLISAVWVVGVKYESLAWRPTCGGVLTP